MSLKEGWQNLTIVLNVLTRGFKKALESPHVIFERIFNSVRQRLLEGAIIGGRFNSPVLLYNWTVIYYETSSISRNVVTSSGVVRSAVQRSADVRKLSSDGRILNSWLWKHTKSLDQLFRWPILSKRRFELEIKFKKQEWFFNRRSGFFKANKN